MILVLIKLFIEFFKIGLFSFGGGYGAIPLFEEVVISNNWIAQEEFYDFVGICESTPGPIMVNLATYIGVTQAGFLGGVVATFAVILPAFLIILIVSTILIKFIANKYVNGFFKGIQPAVIGLILSTGLTLLYILCFPSNGFDLNAVLTLVVLLILSDGYRIIFHKKIPTVVLILLSAGIGILLGIF